MAEWKKHKVKFVKLFQNLRKEEKRPRLTLPIIRRIKRSNKCSIRYKKITKMAEKREQA